MFRFIFLVYIGILYTSCVHREKADTKQANKKATMQDSIFNLPAELHEISGITALNNQQLACIQDEKGTVFIYDLFQKKVVNTYQLLPDGDYEGIACVAGKMYVLKSDGLLFIIIDYTAENPIVESLNTGIPAKDNEGLCFNPFTGNLLIACKSKVQTPGSAKDSREIYSFDLQTQKLSENPVYTFRVPEIKEFLKLKNIQSVFNTSEIKFRISDIAIHPVNGDLFMISAKDHLLIIADKKGVIKDIHRLDPAFYNKPEGLTFIPGSLDLLVSNEGGAGTPSILKYSYIR